MLFYKQVSYALAPSYYFLCRTYGIDRKANSVLKLDTETVKISELLA